MQNGHGANMPSERWGARVLVFTCAASAGAHAGLVPTHLSGEPRLGAAFIAAVVLLVAAATAAAVRPGTGESPVWPDCWLTHPLGRHGWLTSHHLHEVSQ